MLGFMKKKCTKTTDLKRTVKNFLPSVYKKVTFKNLMGIRLAPTRHRKEQFALEPASTGQLSPPGQQLENTETPEAI